MQSIRNHALRSLPALFVLIPFLLSFPVAAGDSLCGEGGQTWFEAAVGDTDEQVSICSGAPAKGYLTWMQFRRGKPGRLSLAWPENPKGSVRSFTYRRYTRFRVTLLKLGFRIGDQDYALLEHDVSEDKPEYGLSLRIRKAGTETDISTETLIPVTKPLSMMGLERYMERKPYDE